MSETSKREPTRLHGPEAEETSLRVGAVPSVAGGLKALAQTVRQVRHIGFFRGVGLLRDVNQKGGFDCPGCAWPEPQERSVAEFCENGAKAVAEEATPDRIAPEFFARWSISELLTQSDRWLGRQGRLTHPMMRDADADHYRPISWDEAFECIAESLRGVASPDEAVFYTSGRTSNEAAFLYQLFVRQFGTNNLPDCSNMCHESSGAGLSAVIGIGKGTVQLEDFAKADAIFVVGQNPGTNHPRMLTTLQEASRRGARIVSVNPLQEAGLSRFKHPKELHRILGAGTPLASLHLPVRINGDLGWFKGMIKAVLEAESERPGQVLDHAFIGEHTDGFDALQADIASTSWEEITTASGLSEAEIREAADIYLASKATIVTWAMGLTQHKNGVANVQMAVNLLLLKGNLGRPGAGVCPVRGHSNVQGDRTMGIHEAPSQAWLERLGAAFDFSPPMAHGYNVVQAIEAMHAGKVRCFFAMGGNFYSAAPDSAVTAEALARTDLTVQVSTKLNRSHLFTGRRALILPCLGRTELDLQQGAAQCVSVENSMGIVHRSQGSRPPASPHLLSEPRIVARLASAVLGEQTTVDWASMANDYDLVRDAIARVIPGFEDYNARVRIPGGFLLPNGVRERVFKTPTGKARFTTHPIPRWALADDELLMMTIRTHDQYNTTIYGDDDRYRGIYGGRRVVLMHQEDMNVRGLQAGNRVNLKSRWEGEVREVRGFAVVPYRIPRGCCATYFPEANPLVPLGNYATKSMTPSSKSVVITVHEVSSDGCSS
jgi:molybdopterin-dependent oxidoreductase alpha subunit